MIIGRRAEKFHWPKKDKTLRPPRGSFQKLLFFFGEMEPKILKKLREKCQKRAMELGRIKKMQLGGDNWGGEGGLPRSISFNFNALSQHNLWLLTMVRARFQLSMKMWKVWWGKIVIFPGKLKLFRRPPNNQSSNYNSTFAGELFAINELFSFCRPSND